MTRLEKIRYEKIFNNQLLGRNRSIAVPLKEDIKQDRYLYRPKVLPDFIHKLLSPLYLKLAQKELNWFRERTVEEGLRWDYLYESGNDIRRDPFHEHFVRTTMHPYHYLMFIWERHPTSKVDFHLPGFEAPDYLRERARKRTLADAYSKISTFYMMLKNNFDAEKTTRMHFGISSYMPLELVYINNLFKRSAWNRLFFNESFYVKNQDEVAQMEYKPYNLRNPEEKE